MDYQAFRQWAADNLYLLPVFLAMAAVVFILLRVQNSLREHSAAEIERLLMTDPALCAERLENNRRLSAVFRKPVIELWKLQAYMQLGQDEKIEDSLNRLKKLKLEPRDRIEFLQQSLSYYAQVGKQDEALEARDSLRRFIIKAKAQDTEPYSAMLEEADTIIGVYVEHDTALIRKLIGKAEHTRDNISRGIIQYRIAKLAYFKGDEKLLSTYLSRAGKNLAGTAYEEIIQQANTNPSVLERK